MGSGSAPRVVAALAAVGLLAGCTGPGRSGASPTNATPTGATSSGADPTGSPTTSVATQLPGGWQLVFHDEFDGAEGTRPDPSRWGYDTGDGGWGNRELQRYTDEAANASLDGAGALDIVARAQDIGRGRRFTSARITTRETFTTRYGRFEARLRLPAGRGLWPAFWLNGICDAGWPNCGEIDVMESVDEVPTTVRSRIHGPGPHSRSGIGRDWKVRSRLHEGYHVYGVEWDREYAAFTFDGIEYERVRRDRLPAGDIWALDNDAYLILNVAVGGSWPGNPTWRTSFPARLKVDWVRVYQR